ncbi:hypothetical protein B0B36_18000 [Pseudomonas syringae pv. actinidifoliorum]|uniref:Uncharacterized protein n=1 Tax=Pseudomonas syringae pv. actinidiae TaxID=103796 RepID=A0A2P0QG40_PSESF|nr:hypothetical protein [Pseudomonas syringae pv. actinidiae]OOK95257.1 hypothetical protein B0B36_18000 [Pseudomonas syringae pv. actinidifoliorum]PYD06639.1 hypothetical protein DND90_09445 [Pseudomonas syringae pv. maculicola]RMS26718.1 hypothetical protein ALP69_200124 [Pseudomonas syringae pv. aceris]OSO54126.1 hypothetical protein BV363_01119 [Pseudomonas syringae pv. actinidiae]
MVSSVEIFEGASIIKVDEVSFCGKFADARIESGHPAGPVFIWGPARAVIGDADANRLAAAGVTDLR